MSRKAGPQRRTPLNRALLTLHKWAGLAAGAWLLVLGVSGILLDHDEWRWQRQMTVPRVMAFHESGAVAAGHRHALRCGRRRATGPLAGRLGARPVAHRGRRRELARRSLPRRRNAAGAALRKAPRRQSGRNHRGHRRRVVAYDRKWQANRAVRDGRDPRRQPHGRQRRG